MLPIVRTLEDIQTVMRQNRRWRRRQRILALRKCNKQLGILRMRNEVPIDDAFSIRADLLKMLRMEERLYQEKDGGDLDSLRQYRPTPVVDNVTPAARDLAEDLGVSLLSVEGTGKDGRIIVKDVRSVH